jgi:hypothetical protein
MLVTCEVADMAKQLVTFACKQDFPKELPKDIVLTGPKYSGKSLAVVLLEYALP